MEWALDAHKVVKDILDAEELGRWSTKYNLLKICQTFKANNWKIK